MSQSLSSLRPDEATKLMLQSLSSRRMRDVIEKRFGLKGKRKTLDAIGKEYKITRERVRQIEAEALKQLRTPEFHHQFEPMFQTVSDHVLRHGGVMAKHHLLTSLVEKKYHPHLSLLLEISPSFHDLPETEQYHARVTVNKEAAHLVEKVVSGVIHELGERGQPVFQEQLFEIMARHSRETSGRIPSSEVVHAHLATSQLIHQNPYGEYGLISWSTIRPRGVKDKAYVVLAKAGKPLHFREVARAIDQVGWSKKKAHPQTVHNELIKDGRFVLVGRGLYALREWGYEPGAVREVLVSLIKNAGRPLTKDEIIQLVLAKRFVKPPTIFLNLQNRALFRRTEDGKYTLV